MRWVLVGILLCEELWHNLAPKFEAASSYCEKHGIEPLGGNWQTIVFQCQDVALYGFANVLHCVFLTFSLADATGQTGAFCHPVTVFTRIKDYLSHGFCPTNSNMRFKR